jgi:copper chaperone
MPETNALSSCCLRTHPTGEHFDQPRSGREREEATLDVPGISCDNCKRAIEGELSKVPDVAQVTVDVAARTVRVEGPAGDDAVKAAIDEAVYEFPS